MSTTDEVAEATEATPPTTVQKLAAEVLGTFVLVLLGCGSVVVFRASGATLTESVDFIGIANIVSVGLSFGLAVMMMAYAVGNLSGGHFNPAVTLGAALAKRVPWIDVPLYMVAQFVGAAVAAAVLFGIGKGFDGWEAEGVTMGANTWGDEGNGIAWWSAGLLELVLTFVFLMVILAVTESRFEHPALAPLAIGLTLAAIHFVGIPGTGTSVNPARSLGPAIFSGTDVLLQQWLFFVFPLAGAAIAGVLYPLLFGADSPLGKPRVKAAPRDAYQAEWNQQQAWGATAGAQQQWPTQQPSGQQQAWPQQQPQQPSGQQQAWPQQQSQQQPQQQSGEQQGWPQQQPQQQSGEQQGWPQQQPQQSGEQQGWPQGQGQPWQGQQQWPQEGDDDGRTQIRPQN